MRRAARTDSNHREIVQALRAIGASVWDTSGCGKGAPDLVCGFRGKNIAFEVKDGKKPPSARLLTPAEANWHECWRGQITLIYDAQSAVKTVLFLTRGK